MANVKCFSCNVRGARAKEKRLGLFEWLKKFHFGHEKFILLQETHSSVEIEKLWETEWGANKIFYCHGTSQSRGVLIIPPRGDDYKCECIDQDLEGRIIILRAEHEDDTVYLINVYAPAAAESEKLIFVEKLSYMFDKLMSENDVENFILGGDLNLCMQLDLDSYGQIDRHNNYRIALASLFERYGLVDAWRVLNPTSKRFTWRRKNPIQQSRLDYWYISTHLLYNINSTDIKPSYRSDHSAITLDLIRNTTKQRGPGFWKFNSVLLSDVDYCEYTRGMIERYRKEYEYMSDHALKWDLIKSEIRAATIAYSKTQARLKRQYEKDLYTEIERLEKELCTNAVPDIISEYSENKQKFEELQDEKTRGAILRSKADHIEYNEKNCKYFLNLEKSNYNAKHIKKLITESGNELNSQEDILEYEESYYKTLLSSKFTDNVFESRKALFDNFFKNTPIPHISANSRQLCENDISVEECKKALDSLPSGKSPGSDGFTTDFYKFFWQDIRDLVFQSFKHSFETGYLSIDQKRGILSLSPKKEKDIRYLKNWRPITLLNTDYKIIAKVLGLRFQKVLPEVINCDQVAYLKDRYIGQNIRTIDDIIQYCYETSNPGILACIDFEKAFDSVEWVFISKALSAFNFGPNLMKWTALMYSDISSCVINNGYSSHFFKVSRGIRQGCPLSAYLFLLVAELLAISIKNNPNIRGIQIGANEVKMVQMADDATVALDSIISLQRCLLSFKIFGLISGLQINTSKSEAMGLGPLNNLYILKPYGLCWKKDELFSLGIHFNINPEQTIEINFRKRLKKFENLLNLWRQRALSIKGKITIIKSIALPQLLYICSNLAVPEWFTQKVNTCMFHFIWSANMDKVKRTTIIGKIEDGGLKMIDLESMIKSQRIMWIRRLYISSNNAAWTCFPESLCTPLGLSLKDLLKCTMNPYYLPLNLPLFYHQLFFSWFEMKMQQTTNESAFDIRREYIMYNRYMFVNNTYIGQQFKILFEKGIRQINNLFDGNGCIIGRAQLEARYDADIDIMLYNSVISAIPQSWKKLLKNVPLHVEALQHEEMPHISLNGRMYSIQLIYNKVVYWSFIRHKFTPPISIGTWQTKFSFEAEEWRNIFQIPYRVSFDSQIQSFQYKILLRIFPCNTYVSKFSNDTTKYCTFCHNQEIDDLEHYFVECETCRVFWCKFNALWNGLDEACEPVTNCDIIFGIRKKQCVYNVAQNFTILYAKWFICMKKMDNQYPIFDSFVPWVKFKANLHGTIARKHQKLDFAKQLEVLTRI